MAVPPFPSLELAKLVLGYLAEEQLMTAYDEFLQASPYLDALQNEYDRVCMTSLSTILADYRAVKIYVETCKPLALRKKLIKCSNLLDIVKILVNYIDHNKIVSQEVAEKSSVNRQHTILLKACEVCNSHDITKCMCKSKNRLETSRSRTPRTLEPVESSIEATSLRDLPGHLVNNEIHEPPKSANQGGNNSISTKPMPNVVTDSSGPPKVLQNIMLPVRTLVPAQLNQHVNQSIQAPGTGNKLIYTAGSFQDFATGIRGPDSGSTNVPDSSTSENIQVSTTKESIQPSTRAGKMTIIIKERKPQNTSHAENATNYSLQPVQPLNESIKATPKTEEQKVTILSDVKVDQVLNNYDGVKQIRMPKIIKNATSTPVFQMQTILINGVPAYKHVPMLPSSAENYTKDEIMAMPTIIVAPASSNSAPSSTCQPAKQATTAKPCSSDSDNDLVPLVIDVEQTSPVMCSRSQTESNVACNNNVSNIETGLVKTVEMKHKNTSMPKDSIVISPSKVNTPQVLPPLRKSSSTPRRSSHIRVLDFKTPRKILHETISENNQEYIEDQEVVLSSAPNLANVNLESVNANVTSTIEPQINPNKAVVDADLEVVKENMNTVVTPATIKKRSWDADLRGLIVAPTSQNSKSKPKKNTKKKTPTDKKSRKSKTENNKSKKKEKNILEKQPASVIEIIDVEEVVKDIENKSNSKASLPIVKPTINIIDKNAQESSAKKDKSIEEKRDKSNENSVETPEAERLSLQNVIGARLNISEFLETPYKQALYDIQMETPKFLGPDIPGDPLSDIKIMNIPTPRFLTSPTAQATPSSYSSRPTDYSSSGSYYKPDDQEYIPSAEILGYDPAIINVRDSDKSEQSNQNQGKTKLRPVRQCTKNVSYCNRARNKDEEAEMNITSDEINNRKISTDSKSSKDATKPSKETKLKTNIPETKKRTSVSKKRKTPVKKDTSKSFMKIKPRKCSPLKTPKTKMKPSPIKLVIKKTNNCKDKIKSDTPNVESVRTKSRRKSSTPRKLHCTKTIHSESSDHDSPDLDTKVAPSPRAGSARNVLDSDTEQMALQWSDDGSQDIKKRAQVDNVVESEDITKIQEYIATSTNSVEVEGNLRMDLISRGFDSETAKKIERDLLGGTPEPSSMPISQPVQNIVQQLQNKSLTDKNLESDTSNNLQIVQDDEDEEVEEVEWSVSDCNQEDKSQNYIEVIHDDSKEPSNEEPAKLKETFTMEVNIDDGVTVRCRATEFITHFSIEPEYESNYLETQLAVSSIVTNFSTLYTPLKNVVRAKCHEIFDSTLTSLDTPLKATSPKAIENEIVVTDLVLEVEKGVDGKEKTENKKRKRQSALNIDESNENKKAKPDTPYVLNPANIQNFDIESVLKQLHGS